MLKQPNFIYLQASKPPGYWSTDVTKFQKTYTLSFEYHIIMLNLLPNEWLVSNLNQLSIPFYLTNNTDFYCLMNQ